MSEATPSRSHAAQSHRRHLCRRRRGAVGAAVPFVVSMWPTERAKAAGAPVEVDISKLEAGPEDRRRVARQACGCPPHAGDARVAEARPKLADPESACPQQPAYARTRSARSSPLLVLVGICTHLGCSPPFEGGRAGRPRRRLARRLLLPVPPIEVRPAGRVYKGVPAPLNSWFRRTVPDRYAGRDRRRHEEGRERWPHRKSVMELDRRALPSLDRAVGKQWREYYAPKNFNFWYYFGSLAAAGAGASRSSPASSSR